MSLWKLAGIIAIIAISSSILPTFFFLFPLPQIVIPFFSLLIKDIYFLNEGCANRLPNGHVNFEVRRSHFLLTMGLFHHPEKSHSVQSWFSEICGVGTAGGGVHDMEKGGVSIRAGSGHPALPPHCPHLQRGRWDPVFNLNISAHGYPRIPTRHNILLLNSPLYLFPNYLFSHPSSGLYLASYESESPENQVEKDRWKALRWEW